jgi:hypothetical protein
MNPTSALPRPTFSATFPRIGQDAIGATPSDASSSASSASSSATSSKAPAWAQPEQLAQLAQRGTDFVKAHWKQLGLAAIGLLGLRSKRLRPLMSKAAMMYALPMAKNLLLARARR